jgi:hypothetical protein
MGRNNWNRPAPVMEKPEPEAQLAEEQSIEETMVETHRQLTEKGWCLWECSALGGDVVIIVIDETITGYPAGLPVYTLQEMDEVAKLDFKTIRLAHEAKKALGAKIEGIKNLKEATNEPD